MKPRWRSWLPWQTGRRAGAGPVQSWPPRVRPVPLFVLRRYGLCCPAPVVCTRVWSTVGVGVVEQVCVMCGYCGVACCGVELRVSSSLVSRVAPAVSAVLVSGLSGRTALAMGSVVSFWAQNGNAGMLIGTMGTYQ